MFTEHSLDMMHILKWVWTCMTLFPTNFWIQQQIAVSLGYSKNFHHYSLLLSTRICWKAHNLSPQKQRILHNLQGVGGIRHDLCRNANKCKFYVSVLKVSMSWNTNCLSSFLIINNFKMPLYIESHMSRNRALCSTRYFI